MKTMLGTVVAVAALAAQSAGMTFTATATVNAPAKKASVPITIHIDRYISDADRDTLVAAIKSNDHAKTQTTLAGLPDLGYIALGEKRTPLKYAYERTTGDGRMITVVTAQPIFFVGGAEPGAKPKQGHELALALMILNGHDTGDGELAPAVTIKFADGAIVTDDYSTEKVRLVKIAKTE
jgi:hypothetical protein